MSKKTELYENGEGYRDEVAGNAIRAADRTPKPVMDVINALKSIASLAGFEVIGRIALKDKVTGREWW